MNQNLQLMQESVETREMIDNDILVLDYANQTILVYGADDLNLMIQQTNVDIDSIVACIADHRGRYDRDEVFVINGFTFIQVSDFMRYPIQASLGKGNDSIKSSKDLYAYYADTKIFDAKPVELLNCQSGQITQYYNLDVALRALDSSFYDILKVPLKGYRQILDLEHYAFPMVLDEFVVRLVSNKVPWTEYLALALEDFEALELISNDTGSQALDEHMIEEAKEIQQQFEINYSALSPATHRFNHYFIERLLTPLMIADILVNGTDEDRKTKLLMDPFVLSTDELLTGWYEVMEDRLSCLDEKDNKSKAQQVFYAFADKRGMELAAQPLMNKDNSEIQPYYAKLYRQFELLNPHEILAFLLSDSTHYHKTRLLMDPDIIDNYEKLNSWLAIMESNLYKLPGSKEKSKALVIVAHFYLSISKNIKFANLKKMDGLEIANLLLNGTVDQKANQLLMDNQVLDNEVTLNYWHEIIADKLNSIGFNTKVKSKALKIFKDYSDKRGKLL